MSLERSFEYTISAALGMCRDRDRRKENYKIISVIGDGGITAGMSYEAFYVMLAI